MFLFFCFFAKSYLNNLGKQRKKQTKGLSKVAQISLLGFCLSLHYPQIDLLFVVCFFVYFLSCAKKQKKKED